jgi:hypothetical protein
VTLILDSPTLTLALACFFTPPAAVISALQV